MKQYRSNYKAEKQALTQEYELQKIELAIDEFKHKRDNTDDIFDKRRAQIEIDYAESKREGFVRIIRGQREERLMYVKLIEELSNSEFGILSDGTKLIDVFDDPREV